ncbi:iron-containing alcohol dehydrogenase, partial [Lichenihabitans sp. Uapishka_5]|uniref:iron-containing alcohol dehydrogenase n=1 Tax=Lichenihabitans sp. Uapishka_5 TaxID=3037302 RepID=UPI0029E7FE1F
LAAVRRLLPGAPLFADTPANPTESAVRAGLDYYRAAGCDGLVAVGGGSPIDLAKGIGLMATHPGPLETYAAILGGMTRITAAAAPVIAIPTTAGTGSEVGRAALLTLDDGRKLGFISPHLIPRQAICDPDLTLGLPAGLTAATGMDALTHCIETFLSPRDNPPADAIALDGAARAWRALPTAVADGRDAEARRDMMMAALQGGLTFQKGLGAVHGLSHALGGMREPVLHHGTLNAVLLPAVLRFNAEAAPAKFARLLGVLGLAPGTDLADTVAAFTACLGLPATLSAMGVPRAALADAAAAAERDHSTATNPRPVDTAAYRRLLDEAF